MLKSLLISVLLLQPFLMLARQQKVTSEEGWTSEFGFDEDELTTVGHNKIVSHEGSWQAGRHGSRAGLMMPGTPLLRARYYQEFAPGVAMDRAEIQSLREVLATPAGKFSGV